MYKCNKTHHNGVLGKIIWTGDTVTTTQYINMGYEKSYFTRVKNSIDTKEDKKAINEAIDNLFDTTSWDSSNNDTTNNNSSNNDNSFDSFGGGDGGGGGYNSDY